MELHTKQRELLQILKRTINEPLSIRELQNELDLSSPSVVQHHIKQLERKGYLRRDPSDPRKYQVIDDDIPEKEIAYVNLYGIAQCGPNGRILDGNPLDRIPIPTRIFGITSKNVFLVKANGDSMRPKIEPNDLVLAEESNEDSDGKIVVCVNNEKVMIKKICRLNDTTITLISLNGEFDPIQAKEDFRVCGIVKGIISNRVKV